MAHDDRRERLAAALRQNLKRRKASPRPLPDAPAVPPGAPGDPDAT